MKEKHERVEWRLEMDEQNEVKVVERVFGAESAQKGVKTRIHKGTRFQTPLNRERVTQDIVF